MKTYKLYDHRRIFTIKELLQFCRREYGEKTAFAYKNKKQTASVSYKQFYDDVAAFGAFLHHQDHRNCKIAIYGENSYEWIAAYFAITCGRNVAVPIDKELDALDVLGLIRDSACSALIYSDTYADIVEKIKPELEQMVQFYNMKDIQSLMDVGKRCIVSGSSAYENIEIGKEDLAAIVYTSGTTGKSKGVMLSHNNIASCVWGASCNVFVSGPSILILPLHHMFALTAGVLASMFYGYPIYINKSLKRLTNDFQASKPQYFFAVPLVVEALYKSIWNTAKKQGKEKQLKIMIKVSDSLRKVGIDLRKRLFKSVLESFGGDLELIISGGAPLDKKYISAFESLGITLLNGYGITECGPIVSVERNQFRISGSVGLPLCCNMVKISEQGEILVKGENVMMGYHNDPEANEMVFCDGWFRTGDLGHLDSRGAVHITGRIKNLIILGNGENIQAEMIEENIYKIPYVKEAIAYGEQNVIVAEVYLDENVLQAREWIEKDIQRMNKAMPLNYNIGKVIVRDSEFPKTTTNKIKRNEGGEYHA